MTASSGPTWHGGARKTGIKISASVAKRRAQLRAKKVPILFIDLKLNLRSGDYKDFHLVFFDSENGYGLDSTSGVQPSSSRNGRNTGGRVAPLFGLVREPFFWLF